jgi:glutathione S-transferase
MTNDLTVWGVGTSRTIRVLWMLAELGLEYELHPIGSRTGETQSADFLRLNPRHKIPVLLHGSFVITESAAILQYLNETFPHPEIYLPNDVRGRARLAEWCYFIMTELDAGSLYVVRRHAGLKHVYGDAPSAVEAGKSYFLHNVDAMEPRIGIESPFLLGDKLSTADILMMTCLEWALIEKLALPDRVMKYRNRLASRPGFKTALAKNFPQ